MGNYYLMNKNRKVAFIEYSEEISSITRIHEMIEIDAAPLQIYNASKQKNKSLLKATNEWFKSRGIPTWRDDLEKMLTNLGIDAPDELLDKAFGLSLSDQYWLKPEEGSICWKDINFFQNDFDGADFKQASFSSRNNSMPANFFTPNNTSDGMLKKAWVVEKGKRILIKGGYLNKRQEPLNECLASLVCEAMGFDHVRYEVDRVDGNLVSKCECFIDEDTELIPAYAVFESEKKQNDINEFNHYIAVLEKHGIKDAREQCENMLVLDYLMMNEDRHTRNFGIIRNVETLCWEKVAPLFDTGQSLNSQREIADMNFNKGTGKLFSNTSKDFEDLLKLLSNPSRFDPSGLQEVAEKWNELLERWQDDTKMENRKIELLVDGFKHRIHKFEAFLEMTKTMEMNDEIGL